MTLRRSLSPFLWYSFKLAKAWRIKFPIVQHVFQKRKCKVGTLIKYGYHNDERRTSGRSSFTIACTAMLGGQNCLMDFEIWHNCAGKNLRNIFRKERSRLKWNGGELLRPSSSWSKIRSGLDVEEGEGVVMSQIGLETSASYSLLNV